MSKIFEEKILSTIKQFDMIQPGDTVVVGFSGGADSVSLVSALYSLSRDLDITLIPAHVNHNLRGEESMRDEMSARNFCAKLNLDLKVLSLDVEKCAKEKKLGIEECARDIRYNFFRSLCKDDTYKIATAHTLSDNAETVLLNLTRGAGLNGLCGIPAKIGNVIRPLIFVKRSEVEQYCVDKSIKYVVDSSNLSRDYARNKMRLDVVPVLKSINPSFEDSIARMVQNFSIDENFLQHECDENFTRDVKVLQNLPKSILVRVIRKFCLDECGVKLEAKHVDLLFDVIEKKEGVVTLVSGQRVGIEDGMLSVIEKIPDEEKIAFNQDFKDGSFVTPFDKKYTVNIKNYDKMEIFFSEEDFLFQNVLDCDTIKSGVIFRYRNPGDIFVLPKRNIKKTIKKLFNELKIPKHERDKKLLLASGNEILWIDGVGVSAKAQVNKHTKKIVIIRRKDD